MRPGSRRTERSGTSRRWPPTSPTTATTPSSARSIPIATRPIFGAEPADLSLLFTLFYIAASGNEDNPGTFERNFNTRDGAQMWRLAGGSQRLCLKMARELGDRVLLKAPVRGIVQDGGSVP